ncbi:Eco57I restriction-modification methylase domain-containing protein [Haladaptatus cibarius]|uniref:Eco57I restriction-modification methylase domain-containing protein n=1 Tax=Haladaptatus cibarius TaxID=453847 RepID=UPI000AE233E1|nr:type II restriction endonuclease subunit M [Haladaptatus cibarius]
METIEGGNGNESLYAKREIILNNLYGVDIDDGAVEICKLRLWLSMVADLEDEPRAVEPLPNLDFNVRQGNSLIGFTGVQEIAREEGDASLANFGGGFGDSVQELYDDVIQYVERHKNTDSAKDATEARKIADSKIREHSRSLNEKILSQFHDAGIEDITLDEVGDYHPFHWVIEFTTVYRDGGFDIIVGNPPWDVLTPNRDDYFTKYDETFRTRMPESKDKMVEQLLEDAEIAKGWEEYQSEMERRSTYFNESGQYHLQDPEVAGTSVGNENDLSMLFFERVFDIVRKDGYVAQILPGVILNGAAGKDLRVHLLNNSDVREIIGFENRGIFEQIHFQYRFGVVTFKNSGTTDTVSGIFDQTNTNILLSLDESSVSIPKSVLIEYSPEARIFPNIESQQEMNVLDKLLDYPSISERLENDWFTSLYAELHRSGDSDRLVEDKSKGDYPICQGKNIFQFEYDSTHHDDLADVALWSVDEERNPAKSAKARVRGKNFRSRDAGISLKKSIYERFSDDPEFSHISTRSQKGFVNDVIEEYDRPALSEEDVLLDSTEYRIVLREIARATDERTLIAGVIPKGAVAVHTLHTVRPYKVNPRKEQLGEQPMHTAYERVFSDRELFVALGLLNSIPFDYLMRTKVDSHIVKYKFEESQLPRLTAGDDWFEYISTRAARLNCYGEAFTELRDRLGDIEPATDKDERRELRAEIDAAAFHAYGLTRRDVQFILNDFHRVSNPRIMTAEYFDLVFETYDILASEAPKR